MSHSTTQPASSTVERHERDGVTVFTKAYRHGGWRDTDQKLRERTAREAEILLRLNEIPEMRGRLGKQRVVDSDPKLARIVTKEVQGSPLQELLLGASSLSQIGSCTRALLTAGRWLASYQTMPIEMQTVVENSANPIDLVAYCQLRLEALSEQGSVWATRRRTERILRWLDYRAKQFEALDVEPCWSHGDFGPNNMIWDGYRLTPIDFATARLDLPWVDATYLIHRMEMLAIQFPWRRRPMTLWRNAVLQGYVGKEGGGKNIRERPIYGALMVRHCICRLLTLARHRSHRLHQRLHDRFVRQQVQSHIETLVRE